MTTSGREMDHFSSEGVKFLAVIVDVIERGETLAVLERDLI